MSGSETVFAAFMATAAAAPAHPDLRQLTKQQ
jgi:hypothetical protein